MPEPVMVGISGLGKVLGVSVMIFGWWMSLYIAQRYRPSLFIVWEKNLDDIGPRSNA